MSLIGFLQKKKKWTNDLLFTNAISIKYNFILVVQMRFLSFWHADILVVSCAKYCPSHNQKLTFLRVVNFSKYNSNINNFKQYKKCILKPYPNSKSIEKEDNLIWKCKHILFQSRFRERELYLTNAIWPKNITRIEKLLKYTEIYHNCSHSV